MGRYNIETYDIIVENGFDFKISTGQIVMVCFDVGVDIKFEESGDGWNDPLMDNEIYRSVTNYDNISFWDENGELIEYTPSKKEEKLIAKEIEYFVESLGYDELENGVI